MTQPSHLQAVSRAVAPDAEPPAQAALQAWLAAARAAWPDIALPAEDFVAHRLT